MQKTVLHIGSNQGDAFDNLEEARQYIQLEVGKITKFSGLYQTAAWGVEDQPDFINQALVVDTSLQAMEVLETVLAIETKMGRVRLQKWGQRLIDIDVIFYEDEIINTPKLTLPHPHIAKRNFVLVPLHEIISCFIHPVYNKNISQLLNESKDTLEVKLYHP